MERCNIECCEKCLNHTYKNKDKSILYCRKNSYSQDKHSRVLLNFYKEFIEYIIESIFKDEKDLNELLDRTSLKDYFNSSNFNNEEYNKILKNTIFIPSYIHFPARDSRDCFDYLKILNLFEEIHFSYCEFYLSNLDLTNVKCFFQDCKFHYRWTLYDYEILKNEDNVIYQTCEFYQTVSNYIPEEQKKLAIYNHSQFDYTCRFHKNIDFNRVCFKDMLFNTNQYNYNEDSIIQNIIFNSCIFEKKFILNTYKIINFEILNSTFKSKFEFKENTLDQFVIDNSNFEKIVDFFESEFKQFKIHKSIFDDFVGFENCKFGTDKKKREEIAIFKYATFLDFVNFRNTTFESGLDIENINIKESPNFLNMNIDFQNTNRETFRIIKYSFDTINNHIEANKYFVQEMQKYKEELKTKKLLGNIQEKIVFNINDIVSSFGQSYVKPIFWIIGSALLYNFILYAYEENCLYKIYPPINYYIQSVVNYLNITIKNILPFTKFLKQDLEFLSLIFYIIYSILIWQTIVSIKRYTKR